MFVVCCRVTLFHNKIFLSFLVSIFCDSKIWLHLFSNLFSLIIWFKKFNLNLRPPVLSTTTAGSNISITISNRLNWCQSHNHDQFQTLCNVMIIVHIQRESTGNLVTKRSVTRIFWTVFSRSILDWYIKLNIWNWVSSTQKKLFFFTLSKHFLPIWLLTSWDDVIDVIFHNCRKVLCIELK